jgi:hypothetical protein
MKGSFFSLLDFIKPVGTLHQMNQGVTNNSPVFIILSLLIITTAIIWASYHYWRLNRANANREKYRLKSAKLIKNGRKYGKKEIQN